MALTASSPGVHAPPEPPSPPQQSRNVALVVIGSLLVVLGLTIAGATTPLVAALLQQNSQGYVTSSTERYTVDTYAITSEQLEVVLDRGLAPAGRAGPVAGVMLRATAATPTQDVFVGIGPKADVAAYLSSVEHSELTRIRLDPFGIDYTTVPGTRAPTAPATQDFWAVSASGPGTQQIESDLRSGSWALVVMNADGSRTVDVDLQAGVRSRYLPPITAGGILGGLVLLAIGITALVIGAAGQGRAVSTTGSAAALGTQHQLTVTPLPVGASAARFTGELDPHVSRGLWLVKWVLAVPHYLVLCVLWTAFVVITVLAGFVILCTGRYPRSLFHFNVGVLRWSWRVGFYAYSALGTDRYPPFTLARTDYPADVDVVYPEHLGRPVVLVKSWLLALPHLILIGLLTTDLSTWWADSGPRPSSPGAPALSISVLGVLVLIAGIILLVTGRYPRGLFDLLLGLNRWCYRVIIYVALMTDTYPPFRLDQGPHEPGGGAGPTGDDPAAASEPDRARHAVELR